MIIVRYCLVLLFLALVSTAWAQGNFLEDDAQYELIKSIQVKAKLLSSDKLKNVFVVNDKGDVIKYSQQGEELARFNEFSLGMPDAIDATNPFQILLFYPEYMTVVTLDNTMSKIAEFDLFDLELNAVEEVCFSNDGNLWLYDSAGPRLLKVDRNNKILQSSDVLYQVLDFELNPNFLLERENRIFVNDPAKGVLIFDIYGQYARTIPILGLKSLQVLGKQLIFYKDKKLMSLHLISLDKQPILLPEFASGARFIRVEKGRIFVAGEKSLDLYQY